MAHGGFVPAFTFLLLAGAGALTVALTWRRMS